MGLGTYGKIIETSLKNNLAYRFDYFVWIFGAFVIMFLNWSFWIAVFNNSYGTTMSGVGLSSMLVYMTMSVIIQFFYSGAASYIIEDGVYHGGIAMELIKPYYYLFNLFSYGIGETIFKLFSTVLPLTLIALYFSRIVISANLFWFLISLCFGFVITTLQSMMIGLCAFWTGGRISGIRRFVDGLILIFSGAVVPLFIFPDWFSNIAMLLPFQASLGTPLSIYIGKIAGQEILTSIGIQIIWVIIMSGIVWVVWSRALKKVFIQGG